MRFGAVVLVSLIAVDPWGWDRFGPLRFALLSAVGFAVVAAALLGPEPRMGSWPRWVGLGWGLLLVGLMVGTAFSDDRWHALVGTPDRHLGLATWLLAVGLFWAVGPNAESARRPVAIAVVVGTAVAGLYTLLELAGVDALDIGFAGDRMGGPLGQPAYLGAAMALTVPIAVGAVGFTGFGRRYAAGAIAAAGLGLFALGASQSRAAVVGLLTALVVAVAARGVGRARDRRQLLAVAAGVLLLAVATAISPLGSRLWALTDVGDGVVAGRLDEWHVGADAFVHAEAGGLIGYGPEGYRIVFGRFVDEQYVIDHGRTAITDRAHNSLLDAALAGGWAGGVGLAILHGGIASVAWRALRRGDGLDAGMGVGLIAYGTQQLFLFPLAELDLVFWIVSGIVVARSSDHVSSGGALGSTAARTLGGAAATVAIAAAGAGLLDVVADHRVDTARKRNDVSIAEEATGARPDSIRYAFVASRLSGTPEAALEHLDEGLDVSPLDPALRTEQASVLLDRARLTDRADHLSGALRALEMLRRDDPNHPESQLQLGVARALAGDDEGAVAALLRAAELAPASLEPLINLAVVHLEAGRIADARSTLDKAREIDSADPRITELIQDLGN